MRTEGKESHSDHSNECNINGHKVSNRPFADDTALLSYTNEGLSPAETTQTN